MTIQERVLFLVVVIRDKRDGGDEVGDGNEGVK
jgi:hypothetical protein